MTVTIPGVCGSQFCTNCQFAQIDASVFHEARHVACALVHTTWSEITLEHNWVTIFRCMQTNTTGNINMPPYVT